MTYDTQRAAQPAKKSEFLLEKDGGEDGGDDDGQGSKGGLRNYGMSGWRSNLDMAWKRGEVALTTTIASTKA